jgi:glutamyl-tRNA(Gln) amidotransferase subunit E
MKNVTLTEFSDDYFKDLGFKSGLEVHQQLNTRQKLFCRCPAKMRKGAHDVELLRHMRPTLSELGEYDGTALMEFKTKKQIRYQLFHDAVCTYEMDDTPPFPINQEALNYAIRIAMLLNCTIVDELHVSRKQYLDGSIPAGFQRTAIVGINGWIPVAGRKVGIIQLGLEEDSCREVSDQGHTIVFRTDRLSIPLVEVVTAPELTTPAEVQEAAEVIRRILRASERVRRGAGSTRADVNVSVNGGTRVEIKGVPRIRWFKDLVAVEAIRQSRLLDLRQQLKIRGITDKRFNVEIKELTAEMRKVKIPEIQKAVKSGHTIMGVRLSGFGGLLNKTIQPGIPFAAELSGRVRVIACLDEMPNLVHTDDLKVFGKKSADKRFILNSLSAKRADVVVVVWGPDEDSRLAAEEIRDRAHEVTLGIPNETRQVIGQGITDFERILPGPDRMYPDTDSPPTRIEQDRVEHIQSALPPRPIELLALLKELGLSDSLADDVLLHGPASLFLKLHNATEANPVDLAVVLSQIIYSLKRRKKINNRPEVHTLKGLFNAYSQGKFFRESFLDILLYLENHSSLTRALSELSLTPAAPEEVHQIVEKVIKEDLPDCHSYRRKARISYCMGQAMKTLQGRTSGKDLKGLFEKYFSKNEYSRPQLIKK